MVEVRGAGITRRQTYLSSALAVPLVENYGQLQVTQAATGKPLAKVYVKVYARQVTHSLSRCRFAPRRSANRWWRPRT
jgi:hypothetical protein